MQDIKKINLRQTASSWLQGCFGFLKKINISKNVSFHLRNIFILLVSYILVSAAIYPELDFVRCLKEIFSLLCMYGAVFIWFMEKITASNVYSILVGITAIFAPVIFISSTMSVATVAILCLIIAEYVVYEYVRGCRLFSGTIPVYIVCDNSKQAKELKEEFGTKFKIVGFVFIDDSDNDDINIETVKFTEFEKQLARLNRMFFLPCPRQILYSSSKASPEDFIRLCEICSKFSLKISKIIRSSDEKTRTKFSVLPISAQDFAKEAPNSYAKQKTSLNAAFKNSRVWIFFDGSEIVAELIHLISTVSSVDLTVFCNSNQLSEDLHTRFAQKMVPANFKTKVADTSMLSLQESKPDMIFYSMPISVDVMSEYSLKEILVKNVLHTQDLIEFAQSVRVKHVFVLSSSEASNASNWVGATQRLGELFAQHADAKNKRLFTKFKVIRLPVRLFNMDEIFNKIVTSVLLKGVAVFHKNNPIHVLNSDLILKSLLKLIFTMLKEDDPYCSAYSISAPDLDEQAVHDLVAKAGFIVGASSPVEIVYEGDEGSAEQMDLENFPNIQEEFEETEIPSVTRTKLLPSNGKDKEEQPGLNLETIRNMNTRELISFVFQAINDKRRK